MTSYDIYILFLCIVVFTMFTVLFTVMLVMLVKNYIKLARLGAEDENIKIEYEKMQREKPKSKLLGCICSVFVFCVTAGVFVAFAVSMIVEVKSNSQVGEIPALKVVKSNSMSSKYPDNSYLFKNDLDDQINTFDLVVLEKLPEEDALEQYDIVAYERDGNLILHRIVNIEEPNDKHPEKRYFLLQGDAIPYADRFPVLYEDMRGIYTGTRVPFIGSFFMFMQSPAGYLCILLILIAMVATPIVERKIKAVKDERYALICASGESEQEACAPGMR